VYEESKRPRNVLRAIPREGWCQEAKIFNHEMNHDKIALSAMKFFPVTRRLMLSICATVFTYFIFLANNDRPERFYSADDPCKV